MGKRATTTYSLIDNRDEIEKATDKAIERALEAVGQALESNAKTICRNQHIVDTGRLKNSITHACGEYRGEGVYSDDGYRVFTDGQAKSDPEEKTVYVGTNVYYAPYVELGTSRMTARPFLRPAVAEHLEEYKRIFQLYLADANPD